MGEKLKNQVAIITGGGRGIGRAIAEAYGGEGCNLILISRTTEELEETAESIRNKFNIVVKTYVLDIGDEENVISMVNSVHKEFNRIDILVNAACILGPVGPLAEIDSNDWLRTIYTNLGGLFFCLKSVLPYMQDQGYGCIINFSGGGALLPNPYFDAYSVCKAATVRLTENLAIELENYGITVCAIAPGGVNTRMFDEIMSAGEEKVGSEIWQDFQERKKKGGDPIEDPQALALLIATYRGREFNGRVISAKWDNWQEISTHTDEICSSDIYTMRRIKPEDRGYEW